MVLKGASLLPAPLRCVGQLLGFIESTLGLADVRSDSVVGEKNEQLLLDVRVRFVFL